MPDILVVDDCAVDRRLVCGLLEKQEGWQVRCCCDGAQALAEIDRQRPDCVVTDLQMPELDGLELVSSVRANYPLTPVILMTSEGSEELAATALLRGAVSYVPKRMVGLILVETVAGVLALSTQRVGLMRVLSRLERNLAVFELENDPTLLAPLVGYLQDSLSAVGVCNDAERMRVGIALSEALSNALFHGNLEVSSELREEDDTAFLRLAELRRGEQPYNQRRVRLTAELTPESARFIVADEGPGFDWRALPDPTDPANLDRLCGRGVLLMRTFMDDVRYNEPGNEVTMIKRRTAAA